MIGDDERVRLRLDRHRAVRAQQRLDHGRGAIGSLVLELERAHRKRLRAIRGRIGERHSSGEENRENSQQYTFHKSAGRFSSTIMTTCGSFPLSAGTSTIVAFFDEYVATTGFVTKF